MSKLFDPELGSRLRAIWTLIVAVLVAIIALLQAVLDTVHFLPDWEAIGSIALFLRAAISLLTTWTKIGNVPK